ncbi:MAG: TRAP transporter substrate-binding protein [Desulfovibrionaceae bacterium]
MKKLSTLIIALALMFSLVAPNSAQAVYELKIQTSLANSSMYYKTLERLKKYIETLSQGEIKVELFADGAVVKSFEIFDAVSQGIVTGGQCWTHWASGKHPAGTLFSAPVGGLGIGLDQSGVLAWMWEGQGMALLNEYYQKIIKVNIKAYPALPMGPEAFGWFHKKYTTFAEFNKLKFRCPPGVPAEVFKEMGMPVVSMSGVDIIPAAQRGVIDAAEWIGPGEDIALGFADVWKHFYLQGMHQAISIGDVYVNLDWYNKLPKHLQSVIDISMKATVTDQLLTNVSVNSQALETLVRKENVVIEETPLEYYPIYMKAARKVLEKYMSDPFFKKVYDSQLAWAKMTVPYQLRSNGLYYNIGKAAMDAGIITDYKK